jgi:hypothetical protein
MVFEGYLNEQLKKAFSSSLICSEKILNLVNFKSLIVSKSLNVIVHMFQ